MSRPTAENTGPVPYEVGVAFTPINNSMIFGRADQEPPAVGEIPGYDEAWGQSKGDKAHSGSVFIERGEEAVRTAARALAGQIGLIAQQIASEIPAESAALPSPEQFGLDSIQISFGVTLSTGIQTIFTAQAESSVLVTLTLSRRPGAVGP